MSKFYSDTICCDAPANCQNTAHCVHRERFRKAAQNTDPVSNLEDAAFEKAFSAATSAIQPSVQSAINAVTHGSIHLGSTLLQQTEIDPNGLSAHTPGAKSDAGKVRVGLVMGGFARALMEVAKVGTAGANKYTPNGWMEVPNGIERYTDARDRHQLKEYMGEEIDPDFGLLHAAHEAWNSLARLDLILRAKEKVNG